MIKAYINYPNPHVTAHLDPNCGNIQSQRKNNQRYCIINSNTISGELKNFRNKKYLFGTFPYNDMWLELDFNDQVFELAILEYICRLLGEHYSPFDGIKPKTHCYCSTNNTETINILKDKSN